MSMQPLPPGQLIAGRYRIQSVLGVGGHACVYLAQQEGLQRMVAIKVLNTADAPKLDVLMKRFEQEARLISQLRDPHTITMYDFGQTPEGMLYMVQEYVKGEALSELFKRENKIAPDRVVKIVNQLLLSLQEAHALGVLHRDIKPQNIMVYTHVGRKDQVKLLDFGIAKMSGDAGQDWTAEGSLVGTPRYIAPERIRGKKLSPSSDLYAVGLVAYELLTGRRVMEGKKGIAALQAQLSDPSTKLGHDVSIPGALRSIIDRMMEKDVPKRYSTAQQVLTDLERWREDSLEPAPPSFRPQAAPHTRFSIEDSDDVDPTIVSGPPASEIIAIREAAARSGTFPRPGAADRSYSSNDHLQQPARTSGSYPPHTPRRDDATVPFDRAMRDRVMAQNRDGLAGIDGIGHVVGDAATNDAANDATVVTTVSNEQIAKIEASVSQEFPAYSTQQAPQQMPQQMPQQVPQQTPQQMIAPSAPDKGGHKALIAVVVALVFVACIVVAAALYLIV